MNDPVKWAAQLAHVREVTLLGTADLAFWTDRLRAEDLVPEATDGRAQVQIIAADAKFMRMRFRELSISIRVVRPEGGKDKDAAFLAQAFNSSRFFAFCERTFFSTPYHHGKVHVTASIPACVSLAIRGETAFEAWMDANASGRAPSSSGEAGWEGPVFLPHSRRKYFIARLRGHTETYPFLLSRDMLTIRPTPKCEILQALVESRFVATEWVVRADATHAKSKTYNSADSVSAK